MIVLYTRMQNAEADMFVAKLLNVRDMWDESLCESNARMRFRRQAGGWMNSTLRLLSLCCLYEICLYIYEHRGNTVRVLVYVLHSSLDKLFHVHSFHELCLRLHSAGKCCWELSSLLTSLASSLFSAPRVSWIRQPSDISKKYNLSFSTVSSIQSCNSRQRRGGVSVIRFSMLSRTRQTRSNAIRQPAIYGLYVVRFLEAPAVEDVKDKNHVGKSLRSSREKNLVRTMYQEVNIITLH